MYSLTLRVRVTLP